MAKTYTKTVAAFLDEERSLWSICDAIADEFDGPVTAGELGECTARLADAGIERKVETIKAYLITGRYAQEATTAQRRVLRAQSVTTVRDFAKYGVAQEAAVDQIQRYQAETGKKRMTPMAVRNMFGHFVQGTGGTPGLSSDPEDWTPAQWDGFDKKVVAAAQTVLEAVNFRRHGWYNPSVEALATLTLVRREDIDAELAALVEGR